MSAKGSDVGHIFLLVKISLWRFSMGDARNSFNYRSSGKYPPEIVTSGAGAVVQWVKPAVLTSYTSAGSGPSCSTSAPATCSSAWKNSRARPKSLGLCTRVGNAEEAPDSWLPPGTQLRSMQGEPAHGKSPPLPLTSIQVFPANACVPNSINRATLPG